MSKKSDAVASLDQGKGKLLAELSEFKEETKGEIENSKEEKTKCMQDSDTGKNVFLEEISNLEENINKKDTEKKLLETQMEEKINTLTSEYETKIKTQEDTNLQLSVQQEAEKREKGKIVDEKSSLSDTLDALQKDLTKVSKELRDTKVSKEICNKEKVLNNQKIQQLDSHVFTLTQEISNTIVENELIAEQLSKTESEKLRGIQKCKEIEKKVIVLSQEKSKLETAYKDMTENFAKAKPAKRKSKGTIEK